MKRGLGQRYIPVSMSQIYRCELYLLDMPTYNVVISPKLKKRILSEYSLEYNSALKAYTTDDFDDLFECFKKKFPNKIEELKINSYLDLLHLANKNY